MELLVLGIIWALFLVVYSISFFLMRSERVTPENRDFIHRWLFSYKLSFEKPVQTVFFPIASSALLALLLKSFIMDYGLVVYDIPQIFLLSLFVFVIGEEIIYRGWMINGFLNLRSGWTLGEYAPQSFKDKVGLVLLVVFGAAIFALAHTEPVTPFLYGILMGGMFLHTKNNLAPCLLVHFTANFMVMLFFLNIL